MNLFFYLDFYFKLFLHCNPKRSYFLYFVLLKQNLCKTETCENWKIIPEQSRSVLGRFYCIYIYICIYTGVRAIRYLGVTLTDQNSIQEEIKSRLKLGNACYHSVQNLLSS